MIKLKEYLEKWMDGKTVRGFNLTPVGIYECYYVYQMLKAGKRPEILIKDVKKVLDKCGIKTEECGIGWIAG